MLHTIEAFLEHSARSRKQRLFKKAVQNVGRNSGDVIVVTCMRQAAGPGDGNGREDGAAAQCFEEDHVGSDDLRFRSAESCAGSFMSSGVIR